MVIVFKVQDGFAPNTFLFIFQLIRVLRYAAKHGIVVVNPDTSPRGFDLPGEHESYDFGSGAGFYVNATEEPWKTNYRMYSYVTGEVFQEFFYPDFTCGMTTPAALNSSN